MSEFWFGVFQLALFVPCVVLHEYAHGYVSYRLGDPTAKNAGRLTLNPIKSIDPIGTVLLPVMLALGGGPVFGYAKGVPINPHYYRDYRKGLMLTGLAGPATNLILAVASGLITRLLRVVLGAGVTTAAGDLTAAGWVVLAFYLFANVNLVLMFFNLIPIPPLDGSRVLPIFLSDRALTAYHRFERQGLMLFILVLFILPQVTGLDPIGGYFRFTVDPILRLLTGIAG